MSQPTPNYEALRGQRSLLRSVLGDVLMVLGDIEGDDPAMERRIATLQYNAARVLRVIEDEVLQESPRYDGCHKLQALDLVAHLYRQAAFSARTFGPGARTEGVCDHIRKELAEVVESGGSLAEWVDLVILALDGAWRSGATPEEVAFAIVAKQSKNEARTWPDWRTADPGKAIEHQRAPFETTKLHELEARSLYDDRTGAAFLACAVHEMCGDEMPEDLKTTAGAVLAPQVHDEGARVPRAGFALLRRLLGPLGRQERPYHYTVHPADLQPELLASLPRAGADFEGAVWEVMQAGVTRAASDLGLPDEVDAVDFTLAPFSRQQAQAFAALADGNTDTADRSQVMRLVNDLLALGLAELAKAGPVDRAAGARA